MSSTHFHPSILLADPDESLCASARRVFERRGYHVTVATDGEQALALFDPKFHVAIVSVTLAKKDGLSLMREIRGREPETQVILLTDAGTASAAMMGLKEGAFAYILKPIADYLQLTHAVERALELHNLRQLRLEPAAAEPMPIPVPVVSAPATPSSSEQTTRALRDLTEIFRQSQPTMLSNAAQAVVKIFGAKHAIIFLISDTQPLVPVASAGASDLGDTAREFASVVGEEFAWRIANEAKTLMSFDSTKKHFHIGSPLVVNDQVIGVLTIYPLPEGAITPERLAWLEAYSAQIAAAVELVRLRDENARLSPADPLTGALREDFFLQIAEREFRRSWRFNESLSAIHVVLDNLDALDETNAELRDRALRLVADVCRQTVRNIDLVSRGQDDSFSLLLLMTDSQGVEVIADRILRAVQLLSVEDAGEKIWLSVRIGVTTYPHEGCTSILDLLEIVRSAHSKARTTGQRIVRA